MRTLGKPGSAVSRRRPERARVATRGQLTENAESHGEFSLYKEMHEIVWQEFVEAWCDVHTGRRIELANNINAVARSGKTGEPDEH